MWRRTSARDKLQDHKVQIKVILSVRRKEGTSKGTMGVASYMSSRAVPSIRFILSIRGWALFHPMYHSAIAVALGQCYIILLYRNITPPAGRRLSPRAEEKLMRWMTIVNHVKYINPLQWLVQSIVLRRLLPS